MEWSKSGTSICIAIIMFFVIISDWGLVFGYVIRNPSNIPFFVIYISAGIIGLIALLIIGYRGRPVNTSSYSHVDDLTGTGYIDYERQKD